MPRRDDPPAAEEDDIVGDSLRLGQFVTGENDGATVVGELADDGPDDVPAVGVDTARRLVEERDVGPCRESQGERHALLLATGQAPPGGPRPVGEADTLDEVVRVHAPVVERTEVGDDVTDPGRRVHPAALQHHAHPAGEIAVTRCGIEPENGDMTGRSLAEPLAHLDGAGLAGPVRAEDHGDLGGGCGERRMVHGGDVAVPHHEVLDDHSVHGFHTTNAASPRQTRRPRKEAADNLTVL